MACRIACPDDKVDGIFDVLVNPVKGGIDKTERSVAVGPFGAIVAGSTGLGALVAGVTAL